jgi:hypothetical protein
MKRVVIASCVFLAGGPVAAWAQTPAAETWTMPRTPEGRPDLQGLWTTQTFTPLQRPERFAGREFLTDEETAELTEVLTATGVDPLRGGAFTQALAAEDAEEQRRTTQQADVTHYDNAVWLRTLRPKALSSQRTSLIVDPPDGRIPPRTEQGRQLAADRREIRGYDSYQNRPLQERCIAWSHEGPPMTPPPYNDLYQIFQAPGYVVLFPEMANNPARIIATDGRPHLSPRIRQWPGDSTGRWEQDTLVVDTTNFTNKSGFQGSGEALHVIERFTRVDADTILYEFTVEDPTTWTGPWSVEMPMTSTDGPLYPYTCHEGNYGMRNTLRGARAADKASAEEAARTAPR